MTLLRQGSGGQGRLADTFGRLRTARNGPGLVTYVTAGDPDLARTEGILLTLDRAGADAVFTDFPERFLQPVRAPGRPSVPRASGRKGQS